MCSGHFYYRRLGFEVGVGGCWVSWYRVVTRTYFRNFLIYSRFSWPNAIIFFCGSPVELRKKFENSSVSVYRRGVSITTKGQFLMYLGQNRKFYWFAGVFPDFPDRLFFLLTSPRLSWPVTSLWYQIPFKSGMYRQKHKWLTRHFIFILFVLVQRMCLDREVHRFQSCSIQPVIFL